MGDAEKVAHAVISPVTFVVDEAFTAPARRQARVAKDQRKVQRRIAATQQAQDERERQLALRQQARQERIRRAQVVSAAEASGVSGSSVEASTIGSGQTIQAAGQAFATGTTLSNQQLASLAQQSTDLQVESQEIAAQQQLFRSIFDIGAKAATAGAGG